MKLLESKTPHKRFWEPQKSTVERVPNALVVSHEQPGIMKTAHWHAQVEVNFVFRGMLSYQMYGHEVRLEAGDTALFWGGLPHRVTDTSEDPLYTAIHLPLVHFFRLRLAPDIMRKLMHGATLTTRSSDGTDFGSFNRWSDYMASSDAARQAHAIDELLLRIERIAFDPYRLTGGDRPVTLESDALDQASGGKIAAICDYIAEHFRQDLDSAELARAAAIHPKYAMNLFKKSTGMTINEYVNLLRLSYAQAMLMKDEANVLQVAMESGFGSLSAFNSAFRRISGMSPTDFRRDCRAPLPLMPERPDHATRVN